jgi:putative endonuclease
VLARRHRRRIGEIDLVAQDGELLVFIEVKTRRGTGYGAPAEAVTPLKRRRMARVAQEFLWRRGWLARPCRFDVVEVYASGTKVERIRHIVDAFRLWPTG